MIIIKTYIAGLRKAQRKPIYINSVIKTLQAFYKYAEEQGFIKSNPVRDAKLLKQNKPIINVFSEEEIQRMLDTFRGNKFFVEAIEKIVKTAAKKDSVNESVRASPHTLRHFYAIFSLKHNLDLYSLSIN